MYRCISSLNGKLALVQARSRRILKSGISDFQLLVLFFPTDGGILRHTIPT